MRPGSKPEGIPETCCGWELEGSGDERRRPEKERQEQVKNRLNGIFAISRDPADRDRRC